MIDIERVFILLFAAWGILATSIVFWQNGYIRKLRQEIFIRRLERSTQRRVCRDCGRQMLDEWYCPKCEGLYSE